MCLILGEAFIYYTNCSTNLPLAEVERRKKRFSQDFCAGGVCWRDCFQSLQELFRMLQCVDVHWQVIIQYIALIVQLINWQEKAFSLSGYSCSVVKFTFLVYWAQSTLRICIRRGLWYLNSCKWQCFDLLKLVTTSSRSPFSSSLTLCQTDLFDPNSVCSCNHSVQGRCHSI